MSDQYPDKSCSCHPTNIRLDCHPGLIEITTSEATSDQFGEEE